MGMFDTFIVKINCWNCGFENDDWQTKQLYNLMDVYKIGDYVPKHHIDKYIVIYTNCERCICWNEVIVHLNEKNIFVGVSTSQEKVD